MIEKKMGRLAQWYDKNLLVVHGALFLIALFVLAIECYWVMQ